MTSLLPMVNASVFSQVMQPLLQVRKSGSSG
jgi:hypothetical protein